MSAKVPLRTANKSLFVKCDNESHSGNGVGKELKVLTRQEISSHTKKRKERPRSPRLINVVLL